MIGSTFKKFAVENGMKASNGVAYGNFRGYAATFSEGAGYKLMVVTTKFPDAAAKDDFISALNNRNINKEFRIQDLQVLDDAITVNFHDTIGTMKLIRKFCDCFFPLLAEYGASGANVCNECGEEFTGNGRWILVNGIAYHLHPDCASAIKHAAETEEYMEREKDTGSYGKGAVGALLGALLGSILWAAVLYLGYFAAIVGLVVGWLTKKGYELLHGKMGKGKLWIIAVFSILGIIIGNFGADAITLFFMINDGTLGNLGYGDILPSILYLLSSDGEYLTATLTNIGLGLLFALLGMWGVFREVKEETKGFSMVNLN